MASSKAKFSCPFCGDDHSTFVSKCPVEKMKIPAVYRLQGRIIDDKYEVLERMSQGGMSIVYAGRQRAVDRKVVLKFFSPDLRASEDMLSRFRNEAKITAAIAHKNIVGIHDMGTTSDGVHFLVMEYLEGATLDELLTGGSLPETMAVSIAMEILSALNAVHSKGVVHRDLKPDNVFFARQAGGEQIVKVLDFGISQLAWPDKKAKAPTTDVGKVYGTPAYMSPEQAKGSRDVDARTDLYSLGVMLYEMVTSQLPFPGNNYNQIMYRIVSKAPIPPARINPDISPDLNRIIIRALEKNVDKRFQSASEFAVFLSRLEGSMEARGSVDLSWIDKDLQHKMTTTPLVAVKPVAAPVDERTVTPVLPVSSASMPADEPASRRPGARPGKGGTEELDMVDILSEAAGEEDLEPPEPDVLETIEPERTTVPPGAPQRAPLPGTLVKKTAGKAALVWWFIPAGAGLIFVLGVIGLVLLFSSNNSSVQADEPSAVRDALPEKKTALPGKKWNIVLDGLPAKASVTVDQQLHAERPIVVKETGKAQKIEVVAPGYYKWEKSVVVESDTTLYVIMDPIEPIEPEEEDEDEAAGLKKKKSGKLKYGIDQSYPVPQ
ncbi:MAG: protein kinase [Pseudomonadota bacterium]